MTLYTLTVSLLVQNLALAASRLQLLADSTLGACMLATAFYRSIS